MSLFRVVVGAGLFKLSDNQNITAEVRIPPSPRIPNWEELGRILSGSSLFCWIMLDSHPYFPCRYIGTEDLRTKKCNIFQHRIYFMALCGNHLEIVIINEL